MMKLSIGREGFVDFLAAALLVLNLRFKELATTRITRTSMMRLV
jgi:hypothetical protein